MKQLLLLLMLLFPLDLFARDWRTLEAPGAVCGDGQPYKALYSKGTSDRIVIEFMEGGACYSEESCSQLLHLRAWIHPIPIVPAYTWATSQADDNPFIKDTVIFFPYCTADVFSGQSEISYSSDFSVHHVGFNNVQLIQEQFFKNNPRLHQFKTLVVMGESAGAIGAMVHAKSFASFFPRSTRKILIADSPGLHFGKRFWNKFPDPLLQDYKDSFSRTSLNLDFSTGFVAPFLGPVFTDLAQWQIGILQATEDIVMSKVFGDISPAYHRRQMLGPQGLVKISEGFSNVAVWAPESKMHTFLVFPKTRLIKDENEQSAKDFVLSLLK